MEDLTTKRLLPVVDVHSDTLSAGMSRRGVYAALFYMACAVLLIMFNKAALSSYNFPCANVITLLQLVCSCILLYTLKYWRIISFTSGKSQILTANDSTAFVPMKTLIRTLPLALAYLLYMVVSMESVRGVNVPMYTTLRRTTVAFTMVVEYFLTRQKHSRPVIVSVSIIILGAYVAGSRDLTFDLRSYGIVFLSNICTAVYLALIARIGKSSGLNSFGLMWCNGIICAPMLLLSAIVRHDFEAVSNFPHLFTPGFQIQVKAVMLLSCIMAFLLNYSVFLNTTLNSALTQTVCGNLKDLFTVAIGWVLFGGLPFDVVNIVGQCLGFIGSFMYAYYKLRGK